MPLSCNLRQIQTLKRRRMEVQQEEMREDAKKLFLTGPAHVSEAEDVSEEEAIRKISHHMELKIHLNGLLRSVISIPG